MAIFLLSFHLTKSQLPAKEETQVLLRNEFSFYGTIHSAGFGVGYRTGRNISATKQRFLDASFFSINHPKEIKLTKSMLYINARSYVYGKENSFFVSQVSYGQQNILNRKPYWGGVEIRTFWSTGAALGFAKPIYLYIFDFSTPLPTRKLEKYDPTIHSDDYIFGRGPFLKGIDEILFHPGLFARAGIIFNHSSERESVRALELGTKISIYPRPIRIMSYSKNDFYFINFYINYHLGRRRE